MKERSRLVNQIAKRLISTKLTFIDFVASYDYDCPRLVSAIVECFPGFRDQAVYNGQQVFFYKRAQILVADLIGAYNDYGAAIDFKNQEKLTMFADYRVPQILREFNILQYSPALAQLVDSESILEYSS